MKAFVVSLLRCGQSPFRYNISILTLLKVTFIYTLTGIGFPCIAQKEYTINLPFPLEKTYVAIDGNRAVAGNFVLEFNGNEWVVTDSLVRNINYENWNRGVAISGNKIIAGTTVFEYDGSSWNEESFLSPGNGTKQSMSINGNQAVIGYTSDYEIYDPQEEEYFIYGAAYIFSKVGNDWQQTGRVIGDHTIPWGDSFGNGVDIQGNRLAVSAWQDYSSYIFEFNGNDWVRTATLDRAHAVALSGDRLFTSDHYGASVYEYDGTTWNYETSIIPDDLVYGYYYDDVWFVAASGNRVVFSGAVEDKSYGPDVVYVYEKKAGAWVQLAELPYPEASLDISGEKVILGISPATVKIFDFSLPQDEIKITASDGAAGDNFGHAVGIKGDALIVGASGDDHTGNEAGSAYIYSKTATNWVQSQKLTATDAAAGDQFGTDVAVTVNYAVVGAPMNDDKGDASGAAYIYRKNKNGWVQHQQAKLLASDGVNGDQFGTSVCIYGKTAVVGAPFASVSGKSGAGAAYIFEYSDGVWNQKAKLIAADGKNGDQFGIDVAIYNQRIVVGAFRADDRGGDSGAVYVFDYTGDSWIQKIKLTAKDGTGGDRFGVSVDVNRNLIIAGANLNDEAGNAAGAAYIFQYNGTGWQQVKKLTAPDAASMDRFGTSVSITSNRVLVGAPYDDYPGNTNAGSIYVFDEIEGSWPLVSKIIPSDAHTGDRFGFGVAMDGNFVVGGAYLDDDHGASSGSVYLFNLSPSSTNSTVIAPENAEKEDSDQKDYSHYSDLVQLVYPNPVQQQLTIQLNHFIAEPVTVELLDASGNILYREYQHTANIRDCIELDLSHANLDPGIMFLKVNGQTSVNRPIRLVKSK